MLENLVLKTFETVINDLIDRQRTMATIANDIDIQTEIRNTAAICATQYSIAIANLQIKRAIYVSENN